MQSHITSYPNLLLVSLQTAPANLNFIFCQKSTNLETLEDLAACNCLMELMATDLDAITTPLVKSLPSFANDAKHVFYIVVAGLACDGRVGQVVRALAARVRFPHPVSYVD